MIFTKSFSKEPIKRNKIKKKIAENTIKPNINSLESLDAFMEFIENYAYLPIKKNATNTVIYDGNIKSNIMVIGEAPGHEEDMTGKPFMGRSGKLLTQLFLQCNLTRNDLYITNLLFWRPPNNRPPMDSEIDYILPLLEQHIKIKKPKVIFCLGNSCLKAFKQLQNQKQNIEGSMSTITGTRGKILKYNNIPLIFSFHPSYILRCPNQKDKLLNDIKLLKEIIK